MRPRSSYIFVDSSAWYALVNARDKNHLTAKRFLNAGHRLLTTNFVIDEFTDCTSFVVMERLGLTHAFAFDEHFSQTGQFVCVPHRR